jgi:glycosyltransferase involved in cell wall biosynthesis
VDRPPALREAILSVLHQTYDTHEIIVVQDGKRNGENEAVINAFDTDRIRYIPTGEKVGRCRAGNIGMASATGEYINFLDDDDLFFADHLETLVGAIMEKGTDAAYGLSFVTPQVITQKPYTYRITNILHGIDVAHNPHSLLYFNQFPIQGVLFSRHLYEKHGGFDEDLAYLEDWDLWLRYCRTWRIAFVEKTTSLFRIPGELQEANERRERLQACHEILYAKYDDHTFSLTGRELIEMSNHIFDIFPLKMMRHEIDNMDNSLARHCVLLSERDPVFNNSLKIVLMNVFEKVKACGTRSVSG